MPHATSSGRTVEQIRDRPSTATLPSAWRNVSISAGKRSYFVTYLQRNNKKNNNNKIMTFFLSSKFIKVHNYSTRVMLQVSSVLEFSLFFV